MKASVFSFLAKGSPSYDEYEGGQKKMDDACKEGLMDNHLSPPYFCITSMIYFIVFDPELNI